VPLANSLCWGREACTMHSQRLNRKFRLSPSVGKIAPLEKKQLGSFYAHADSHFRTYSRGSARIGKATQAAPAPQSTENPTKTLSKSISIESHRRYRQQCRARGGCICMRASWQSKVDPKKLVM
jgi:hypothetical protein